MKFERIFRNAQDTVLFAVVVDNAMRHVMVTRWPADETQVVRAISFNYADQTERAYAFSVATDIARHLARSNVNAAAEVLAASPFAATSVKGE